MKLLNPISMPKYRLYLFIISSLITFLNVDYGLTYDKKINQKLIIDETFLPSISIEDSIYSIKLLNKRINEIIASEPLMSKSNYSVSVYSIDNQRYFYQRNPNLKLIPASTTKLITSFVYLVSNFPDYNLKTTVYADLPYHQKGVLNSNLYLYGRGNVLLKDGDMDSLAGQLKSKGIHTINGDIFADDTYFDGIKSRFKYSGDADEVQAVEDISALGMAKNHYTITIRANAQTGAADIIMNPRSSAFHFINNTKVLASNVETEFDDDDNQIEIKDYYFTENQEFGDNNSDFAAKKRKKTKSKGRKKIINSGAKISFKEISHGEYNVVVSGTLSKNYSNSFYYKMEYPEIFTAGSLKNALERNGINVNGKLEHRNKENYKFYGKDKQIAEVGNDAIEMMKLVNKYSDNFIAEHFFKINGSFYKNFNSNYEAANYLLEKVADSLNLKSLKCVINDGSGLSRRNKITTETLIDVLNYSSQMEFGEYFDSTLAIAGVDGTLRKRMIGTKAENNVKAKTGTHRNVSALAGYVKSVDNENFCFSIISNGNGVYAYKNLEDRIAVALAEFKYVNKPTEVNLNSSEDVKQNSIQNMNQINNSSNNNVNSLNK
ncbi:MAG: D-alanyl-D-alanine carboxypeptidase/D-alanyl-D-alanine endopeptidase [Candidatus Kapaibacteriota bacterium]